MEGVRPRRLRTRRLAHGAVALLVTALLGVLALPIVPASSAELLTFTPTDDATIRAGQATQTAGHTPRLLVDASPRQAGLLRFTVAGVGGRAVAGAVLRLHVLDPSILGGSVAPTTTASWSETTVTWQNAPAAGAPVATLGRVRVGNWYELDVTPLVTGDGIVSLRLDTTSPNGVDFAAKESGPALAPQLLVTLDEPTVEDVEPPSVPGNLRVVSTGASSVGLAWDASTDDTGVAGYDVTRDGSVVSSSAGDETGYVDSGLTPGTAYTYAVRARDASGKASDYSGDLAVTTGTVSDAPVLVGAGDIATCRKSADSDTAALVAGIPGTVFTAGDNAYPDGSGADFANCYEPSWGQFRSRTRPAAGNHDYRTPGASGYFDYFGAAAGQPGKGYYSYDIGTWHIVVLNSNCGKVGGCGAGSPQEEWLRSDLAASTRENIGAFWHHPWKTSATRGTTLNMTPIWQALYDYGADFAVGGHDHVYERFAPLDPLGNVDPEHGIRSFIVGTGGAEPGAIGTQAPNSEVYQAVFGVLKLTLHADSYDWDFLSTPEFTFTDSGSGSVHGAPAADTEPPSAPQDLVASASSVDEVGLSWSAAQDNVATVGYQLRRNSVVLPAVGNTTTHVDQDVVPGQTYTYEVRAADAAGNLSDWSQPASATTPAAADTLLIPVAEDADILPGSPDQNRGGQATWGVDASPAMDSVLKLEVAGLDGRVVESARLHLTCVDASGSGGQFFAATGAWSESAVTWNTAPVSTGGMLGSLGKVVASTAYTVDLTGYVTGEGTYSLRASSTATNGADYASSEAAGGLGPVLELTLAPAP